MSTDDDRIRLGQTGHVYVTLAAAEQYAEAHRLGLQIERARKELTVLLLRASRPEGDQDRDRGRETWRRRSKSEDIDITATIVREGPLAVVVGINARAWVGTYGRGR